MQKPDSHFGFLDPRCTTDPQAAVRPLNFARRADAGAPPRASQLARAAVSGQWERRGAWSGRHLPRSHSRDRRQEGNADWLSKAREESGSGSGLGAGAAGREGGLVWGGDGQNVDSSSWVDTRARRRFHSNGREP